MSDATIEDALKITLADYRLSRGEKQALAKVIEKCADDAHRLAQARQHAFKIAREELIGPDALAVVDWLEDVVKVLLPIPTAAGRASEAYFSPRDDCVNKIVRLFKIARKSVDICVFTITDDRIKDAILAAHRRKVSIRIISDDEQTEDIWSDVDELDERGIPVRLDQSDSYMHHKYALFDNRRLLTGSYNWTRRAAESNEENIIITSDSKLIEAFRRAFEQLWKKLQ